MAQNESLSQELFLSSSPHIASKVAARNLMTNVLIALAPATVFGVLIYGIPALLNILVSIVAAVAGESLFRCITKQDIRAKDLSAVVTGLLLALVLPPTTPLWMTALGAVFAVVVAKEFFGGLGANVFNPALIGRAFLLMSFPASIATWARPLGFGTTLTDAVTGPTPLGIFKLSGGLPGVGADFVAAGLAKTPDYWTTIKTLFIGIHGGTTGESSILLILVGAIFLLATKTIDWRAPLTMIVSACILSLILGMDPLFSIFSGGLIFGAFFMATDYVSAPLTAKGKLIFGCGAGIIAVLIRVFGNYPEGVSYGILIMNAATPFLNRFLQKKYGFVPKKKPAPAGGAQGGTK
ncbi:RnfD [Treponema primitia ZAS-2]|uniref:Ion-translocating oxidoreductase complex subunit D n=1 Tax=Treponema primitia (strain ATCC BAA-887 / DSM 12427 / ZAS-2) TaxID=545694 RepID=F5YN67_TREPZ|nr:RnfABCDGE type electron transport complex subunit D [Treponema primitia]AEF85737.1 RnfD [Treponema primitia ZAS-2]